MSLKKELRKLYQGTDQFGKTEQEKMLKHIIRKSQETRSLRDLLKLLHYLDNDSAEIISAMDDFISGLVPIILPYIGNRQKESFLDDIQEAVDEAMCTILEKEKLEKKLPTAGGKEAERSLSIRTLGAKVDE